MSPDKEQRLQAWAMFARMWISENTRRDELEAHLPMLDEGDLPHALFYATDGDPVMLAKQIEGLFHEGPDLCPFCDHRIAIIELSREDDGQYHCNHCRGQR